MNTLLIAFVIFVIAFTMVMTGKGGGNFYVVALVIAGQSIHNSATMGQLILILTAITGVIIFHRNKAVDWKLALVIDPVTDVMAFVGGYFSGYIEGVYLKIFLAILLVLSGFFMLIKVKNKKINKKNKFGYWKRDYGGYSYVVNLWLTIPITALVGLAAGALGISGGSFKVPLMVLLCGVPMRIAVGTSSAMVAVTALMGFIGHAAIGHFDPTLAIPLGIAAITGGLLGSKFAIKTKPENLKKIFAYTTLAASIFMIINAITSY